MMLRAITWTEYWIGMSILVSGYYVAICIVCYRQKIKDLLNGGYRLPQKKQYGVTSAPGLTDPEFDELEDIIKDLRYAILERAGKEAGKEALLRQLQQRLANYSGLRKPAFRIAINNYLVRTAPECCGVHLSENELDEAWDEAFRS